MRGIVVVLAAAALLALAVTASDTESDAQTSEDLSHLTAAERKLLGYINVRGPRKNWVNKVHKVHILSRLDGKDSSSNPISGAKSTVVPGPAAAATTSSAAAPAPAAKNVIFRYKKFPFRMFLKPLRTLAKGLERQRRRGLKRYLKLRRMLLGRAPVASSVAPVIPKKSAHELELEGQLSALKAKIAKREAEVKLRLKPYCNAGDVYFCVRGRCACTARATAQCTGLRTLTCRAASEVGTLCRCARAGSRAAARRRAAALAVARARQFARTCNIRSAKCRRARRMFRVGVMRRWATRRKFLNKQYDRAYRRYVELLARYFKKKYRIMMTEYKKKYKNNEELKKRLDTLLAKHKAAMLHHAKLHNLAFLRYSKLMADYRGLDDKYNKLVDKYQADMANALDRLKSKREALAKLHEREDNLVALKSKLESKIQFLESEVAKKQTESNQSSADHKTLVAKHKALKAEFEKHKKDTEKALEDNSAKTVALKEEVEKQKEVVDRTKRKLARAQAAAAAADKKAAAAYAVLKSKYDALQKQADDAAAHDKAALAALRATNTGLKNQVTKLKTEWKNRKSSAAAAKKKRAAKLASLVKNAAKAKTNAAKKIASLKKKLASTKTKLAKNIKKSKSDAARYQKLAKSSSGSIAAHKKLAAENLRLQTAYRKSSTELKKKVKSLSAQLKAVLARHSSASAQLKKFRAIASKEQKEEKALRSVYNSLNKKYTESSQREKAAESELVRLRNEIKEIKSGRYKPQPGSNGSKPSGVDRAEISVKCGNLYAAEREANKKDFAHRFDHYDFYKVRVDGEMTSENIAKACAERKLQTPCDHPAYSDGSCTVVMKRALHFSYNGHHTFPRWLIDGTYWYTNQPLSLYNTGTTHRWSNSNDRDGYTMCVLPTPCQPLSFTWGRFRFFRVRVPGQISNEGIIKACEAHGLEVPCDHPSYADGQCMTVMKHASHLSYNGHHDIPRQYVDRTYFYSGANSFPLQNWQNTHRWAATGDRDGLTLCVAPVVPTDPKKVVAKWHGYNWYRIRIHGAVTSEKIYKACKQYGYQTPCDHPAYADGQCTSVTKSALHLSYAPHNTLPRAVSDEMYFYTGKSRFPLQNWRGTHRWATAGDRHGDTLCIKRAKKTDPKKAVVAWRGYRFYKVRVPGQVTNAAIYKACKKQGYETVCDHEAYEDDKCITVLHGGRHMSYSPHHDFNKKVINRVYFYAGSSNKFPLQNWRNTHRWAAIGDRNVNTLCAKRIEAKNNGKLVSKWHGYAWYKVRVTGRVTSAKIAEACTKFGYETPCDHISYADGKCVAVMKQALHLSYSPHHDFPKKVIDRCYFYTGYNREPLQNWENTHRWARAGDHDGNTLCVKKLPTRQGYVFTHNGFKFYRERVNGRMTPDAVREVCAKKNMFVPCDHPSYADGHCVAVVKQSLHLSYAPHHSLDRPAMDRCYFYAGESNQLLQNWRNTHRWSGPGDFNGDTMCVTPVEIDSKAVAETWKGYKFHKVLVEGPMTNENIAKACSSRGFRTPCDHSAYDDGQCVVINGAAHMSYNGHHNFPRSVIDRTYWYTGANHAPLQNWRNTHRWANPRGDMWEYTLCIE